MKLVVEVRKAMFWPTSGLKERHINNSEVSEAGTLISVSMVPHGGGCLGKRTKPNHWRSYNSGVSSITPVGNALASFCASLELARVVNCMYTYSWLSPPFWFCLYLYRFLWRTRLLAHVWTCFSGFNKRIDCTSSFAGTGLLELTYLSRKDRSCFKFCLICKVGSASILENILLNAPPPSPVPTHTDVYIHIYYYQYDDETGAGWRMGLGR